MNTSMRRILVSSLLIWGGMASAVEEGTSTQELLIEKLEHVYKNLAPNDASKIPVTLRLADLLADRARIAAMKDLESGCTVCTAGQQDREKALRLYQEALPKTPASNRGRVIIQVGHLYELMGREKEAIQYYELTAKDPNAGPAAAEAHLSLAEIYFKKNRFAEAKKYYSMVLADTQAGSRGLAAYRIAWCELNMGEIAPGLAQLRTILTTPALQNKSGVAEGQPDRQFVEEVSRDYATWMAKVKVGDSEINELVKLSPETTRQTNLITLAAELERTGKKSEAAQVWQAVYNQASASEVRLEALVRLVPLTFSESATEKSLQALETATVQWQELKGCGKTDCTDLQKNLRGFLVNWNQSEKKAPSENLLKGYQAYLRTFPQDGEVAQWAAQVAKDRKDWATSLAMMSTAAGIFAGKKENDKLESTLLGQLEVAELSKDKELWNRAAQSYLAMSPKKTKAFEVRYQQAHNIYDAGDYKVAREKLNELALTESAPRALRIQAANLSLDASNLLKDDAALLEGASTFAKTFGGADAVEFSQIRYKAAMNNVAKLATEDPDKAFLALAAVDVAPARAEDKKLFLKNKMILAEKSKRFTVAAATADEYLALKDLTVDEREQALAKKAWLSELRLDFVTALKTTEGLKTTLKPDQKALKLALYADLSGAESRGFYQQYLNVGSDNDVKKAIAAQMVRRSKTPLVELTKQSALLGKDPELLARLYTEIYVKTPDPKLLTKILADKRIEKTAWGRSLARTQMLAEIRPIATRLTAMKVDSSNQKLMASTIKARAAELTKLEKLAQKTVDSGDWTTELVSLDLLARESERFYQEILSLPMPEGLSGEEESQYLNLLTQQASPYKNRAETAKAKTQELWATAGWKEALQKSLNEAGEFKPLVTEEIAALKLAADKDKLATLDSITVVETSAQIKPTREVLETARNEVRQNPMDHGRIEKLLGLEKQAGDFAMVHYLEERLRDSKATTGQEKTL